MLAITNLIAAQTPAPNVGRFTIKPAVYNVVGNDTIFSNLEVEMDRMFPNNILFYSHNRVKKKDYLVDSVTVIFRITDVNDEKIENGYKPIKSNDLRVEKHTSNYSVISEIKSENDTAEIKIEAILDIIPFKDAEGLELKLLYKHLYNVTLLHYKKAISEGKTNRQACLIALDVLTEKVLQLTN